jgi:hypothetical protein
MGRNVAYMVKKRNACNVSLEKPEGNSTIGKYIRKYENNIKSL